MALHCHYTGDTQYRFWFDLDNSLSRWKRPIFKIPFSRNSKSSVWKPNFFPRQAKPKILFALNYHYTCDTQYRVWFDLDNSLTRWKRSFLKTPFSRSSKNSVWNTNFFPDKLFRKLFALHSHYTVGILHTEFGLIWITPWPDERELFLKFAKVRNPRNSQSSVWKPNFFPRQAIPTNFLLYTLITLGIIHTEFGLVWITPWPDERELFLKFAKVRNPRNSQSSVWKPYFFPRQAIPTIFLLQTLNTLVIRHNAFGSIWTTP